MFKVFIIIFVIHVGPLSELNIKCNYKRLMFLSLALKQYIFIRIVYFNHAANLFKYLDKLLKKIIIALNRLTDYIIGQNSYRSVNGLNSLK